MALAKEIVTKEIKTGDPFFLDGKDYVIAYHPTKPDILVLFVDKKRQGVCLKKEVIWHTKLNKWTMMGRLLTEADKNLFMLKSVEMPWGTSLPGWGPRADDQELVRVMLEKKEL